MFSPKKNNNPPRLLIVDDTEGSRQILSLYAELAGFEARLLGSAEACRLLSGANESCLRDFPCGTHLLVNEELDLGSGHELIRLQAIGGCLLPARFKAVISSRKPEAQVAELPDSGCQYLPKPLTYEHFVAWIGNGSHSERHLPVEKSQAAPAPGVEDLLRWICRQKANVRSFALPGYLSSWLKVAATPRFTGVDLFCVCLYGLACFLLH